MKIILSLLLGWLLSISELSIAVEILGSGSYMPDKLYKTWGDHYASRNPGFSLRYNISTPADGMKDLLSGKVDFAAVDLPLSVSELEKYNLIQFPVVLTAVSIVINVPGISKGELKLDAKTLAMIFMGKVTQWNDPAIVQMNPMLRLPNRSILLVHRITPTGVPTILGTFLSQYEANWKSVMGLDLNAGTATWPKNVIHVKTANESIEAMKQPYTLAHVEISTALRNNFDYVKIKNRDGQYVSPGYDNLRAAAVSAFTQDTVNFTDIPLNQHGDLAWPITTASFVLIKNKTEDLGHKKEIFGFFRRYLRFGELSAMMDSYVPLPTSVTNAVSKRIALPIEH